MERVKSISQNFQRLIIATVLISTVCAVMIPKTAHAGSPGQGTVSNSGSQVTEQNLTELNESHLDKVQPAPSLNTSLERDNLIKRLKLTNNANQLGYVYLLGFNGDVVAHYTVKGKVSSLNSFLTTTEQIRCPNSSASNTADCNVMNSPDLDGSYGQNPSGIFFFTTTGAYVEWSGTYIYSTQPLNITTPVSLTETVGQ